MSILPSLDHCTLLRLPWSSSLAWFSLPRQRHCQIPRLLPCSQAPEQNLPRQRVALCSGQQSHLALLGGLCDLGLLGILLGLLGLVVRVRSGPNQLAKHDCSRPTFLVLFFSVGASSSLFPSSCGRNGPSISVAEIGSRRLAHITILLARHRHTAEIPILPELLLRRLTRPPRASARRSRRGPEQRTEAPPTHQSRPGPQSPSSCWR